MENLNLEKVLSFQGHDDFVEYFIFLDTTVNPKLEESLLEFTAAIQCLTEEYIWQRDSLQVSLVDLADADEEERESKEKIRCLHGVTRFGENVEDEWFSTWVFLQLTKKFPGCVIRVIDNDGEFLLIEAAEHLPNWAASEASCRKRVYLYDGAFHLIPKYISITHSGQEKGIPGMIKAVRAIRDDPTTTMASEAIQSCIKARIGNYPEKMFSEFQRANLMLPPKLAAIITQCPSFVAPAINAFYYREPIELRMARVMRVFKPVDGLVKSRVQFTKCLYAMLSKQDFRPDSKSGWTLPRPTAKDFKAHSLGAKLTTGFEILLARKARNSVKGTSSEDISSSSAFQLYLKSLKSYGYFQDYLEGSKPYRELLSKAEKFYKSNLVNTSLSDKDSFALIAETLHGFVDHVHVDLEMLKREAENLPEDDDDSWMELTPMGLETMLEKQFRPNNDVEIPKVEDLPAKLREFLTTTAEVEGVDLPANKIVQSNGSSSPCLGAAALDPLDFRADDFVSAIDKLLTDLGKPDGDWEASDDDDSYGEEDGMKDIFEKVNFREDSKIHQFMQQMDKELSETEVGKSFSPACATGTEEFDDVENFEPVDIDINALTNMLKSFQSQELPTGPSTNLLKSVCFDLSKAVPPSTAPSTSAAGRKKSDSNSGKKKSQGKK